MKATPREKAIIFAFAAGYIDSWLDCYRLSREKPTPEPEGPELKNARTIVTRWKQREEIKKAYESAQAFLRLHDETIARKTADEVRKMMEEEESETGPADNNRTQGRRAAAVDYYNPENQRKTINAIIDRSADDPKTQLDAIKAIQQTQRDDRQAAKDNQIQRYYTPVTCKSCPLYQKRTKKG